MFAAKSGPVSSFPIPLHFDLAPDSPGTPSFQFSPSAACLNDAVAAPPAGAERIACEGLDEAATTSTLGLDADETIKADADAPMKMPPPRRARWESEGGILEQTSESRARMRREFKCRTRLKEHDLCHSLTA